MSLSRVLDPGFPDVFIRESCRDPVGAHQHLVNEIAPGIRGSDQTMNLSPNSVSNPPPQGTVQPQTIFPELSYSQSGREELASNGMDVAIGHYRDEDAFTTDGLLTVHSGEYFPEDHFGPQEDAVNDITVPNAQTDPLDEAKYNDALDFIAHQEPAERIDSLLPTLTFKNQRTHASNKAGVMTADKLEQRALENAAYSENNTSTETLLYDSHFPWNISWSLEGVLSTPDTTHEATTTSPLYTIAPNLKEILLAHARRRLYERMEADAIRIVQQQAERIEMMKRRDTLNQVPTAVESYTSKRNASAEVLGDSDKSKMQNNRRTSQVAPVGGHSPGSEIQHLSTHHVRGPLLPSSSKRSRVRPVIDGAAALDLGRGRPAVPNNESVPSASTGHQYREGNLRVQGAVVVQENDTGKTARDEHSVRSTNPTVSQSASLGTRRTEDKDEEGASVVRPQGPLAVRACVSQGYSVKPHNGKRPRMRFSKNAKASTYCHICGRSSKSTPIYYCSNILVGLCRKVLCEKCIIVYEAGPLDVARQKDSGWLCSHCRGECPDRARCAQYRENNKKRRERNREERVRKRMAEGNDGGAVKRRRCINRGDGDCNSPRDVMDGQLVE